MERLRSRRLTLAALLPLVLARSSAATPPLLVRHEASRMSMGSAYAIVAYGADAHALPGIVESAFDEVDRIDRLMSHYKADSPLSRLNREADKGPVAVDAELFALIAEALRYSRESDGAFDITVGPLMKTWGFFRGEGRLPSDAELAEVKQRIGYGHVVMDPVANTIRFDRPGMELDLGGIAKGYAVDRVVALLRAHGVPAALVSAGGSTVYGLGAPPGQRAWDVGVQDPLDPRKTALTVRLKNRALSVSGSYEKSFEVDGVLYSHIMDPRTARPVQGVLSVAVVTRTGTEGDALDNVLFVQGVDLARASVARVTGAEAFLFLPERPGGWKMVQLRGGGAPAGHLPAVKSTTP
jgi:thiamine biosynthesis lipoprotein